MIDCKQCGDCCKKYYITLCEEDILMWETAGREDILEVADIYMLNNKEMGDGFWRKGGDEPHPAPDKACPWLMYQPRTGKYVCRINDVKPMICRDYACTIPGENRA